MFLYVDLGRGARKSRYSGCAVAAFMYVLVLCCAALPTAFLPTTRWAVRKQDVHIVKEDAIVRLDRRQTGNGVVWM